MSMTREASVLRVPLAHRRASHGQPLAWRRPVAGGAFALAVVALPVLTSGDPTLTEAAVVVVVCSGFTIAGLLEAKRLPDNAVGPLLCLFGVTALLSTFVAAANPLWFTLGYAVHALPPLALAHLLLCYPSGELRPGLERTAMRAAYLVVSPLPLVQLLVYDPTSHTYGLFDCPVGEERCPHSVLMLWDVPAAYEAVSLLQLSAQVVTALGLTALVVRRTVRSSPRSRWIFVGLLAVAILVAARVVLGNLLYLLHRSREFEVALFWTAGLAQAGVAGVLLHGLLRRRLAHASVSSLLVELGRAEPAAVERAVGEALKDPSLRLGFWLPERDRYVDVSGAPLDPPPPASGPGVTRLDHDGKPLAVILHDPSLDEEPGLVEAAGAAAALALQNMRLQAELRARLLEL